MTASVANPYQPPTAAPAAAPIAVNPLPATVRLTSVDAYRGLVMFLMMAEVLHLKQVSDNLPGSGLWKFLSWHQTHVEWAGCTLHDLIQPSFSMLVGVALPFSLASRIARGQSKLHMTLHAAWRAVLLTLLGVFLRSSGHSMTNFTFEDTLSQIGMGYLFLFLLGFRPVRDQWIALAVILIGYWAAFALYPLPGADFDYARVGVPAARLHEHGLSGFAEHWQKNSNLAWALDTWFLNLFPREAPFRFNGGGYATLSFIPTLGTMILGLIAGNMLRGAGSLSENRPQRGGQAHFSHGASKNEPVSDGSRIGAWSQRTKFLWLIAVGVALLLAGWLCGVTGVCPVVKRIWTPSWVLFSGGWCYLLLAAFYGVMEMAGWRAWAFPLRVIGMNSIAAYCMAHWFEGFFYAALPRHFGQGVFNIFGAEYEPLIHGAGVLLVLWLILYWMYRQKIFVKI